MSHEETGFKSAGVYVGQKLSTLTAHCGWAAKIAKGANQPPRGPDHAPSERQMNSLTIMTLAACRD